MARVLGKSLFSLTAAATFLLPRCASAVAQAAPEEVWVSDSEGVDSDDMEVADGTEQLPYKTIQFGIGKVAVGGTVKIMAGVYDEGETSGGGHSNRVSITKKVTLEGVDGKDNTHIVGFRDFINGGTLGCCKSSVRCVWIDRENADGTVLKNLTIRDGGANTADGSSVARYSGGGVQGTTATGASSAASFTSSWLVDCVVSNCAAGSGGAINGVNAIRCLISDNIAPSYGTGARCGWLVHCLVTDNKTTNTGGRGAVYYCHMVNCTVANSIGTKAYGIQSSWIHNTISFNNAGANVNGLYGSMNSYTSATGGYLYDPDNGDFRLAPGTAAVGGALVEYLSLASLPTGVSAYTDYAGGEIDSEAETCDAGCMQGAVREDEKTVTIVAANGGIAVTGASVGENTIAVGDTLTFSPAAGTRPCTGVSVNGVDYLFDESPSINVTITSDFASSTTISAIYTKNWYVDANAENDEGTGFRPGDPKKHLSSVLPLTSSGDTVHAAAGRYEEGHTKLGSGRLCRGYVKNGVTLVADEGPEKTFIFGAASDDPEDSYGLGLGTNGMACVCIADKGHVKGFTLTGGHSDYATSESVGLDSIIYAGGGVVGAASASRDTQYVEDCIVSNNCASYGAGGARVNFIRCRVLENKALNNGGGAVYSWAYGTVFDKNRQGTSTSEGTCRSITKLFGCTIGPANLSLDGTKTNRAVSAVSGPTGQFHGCIFMGGMNDGGRKTFDTPSTYCIFAAGRDSFPTNEGCTVVSLASIRDTFDADLRPIAGKCIAADAWDAADFETYASARLSTGFDLSGAPRARNGRIDIGALESDPKPWYGKLLDGKGKCITVTEADAAVTNIASGVTLQDGMAVSLTWSSAADDALRTGHVRVTGEGTLTVTKDGEPYATYTEADGEVEFSFAATGRSAALQFSFAGEGAADVYSFSSPIGTMLPLR